LGRFPAFKNQRAIPDVMNLVSGNGNSKNIPRRVRRVAAELVNAILQDVCPTSAVEAECEIDVGQGRVCIAVAQSCDQKRVHFSDRKFDVPIARRQFLL
jgi:hypothetical protein